MAIESDPFAKPDPSKNEVAIRAAIDGSGLTLTGKSRALAALDRLVGAALDIPGIWFKNRAERARLFAVTERELLKTQAGAFLSQSKSEPDQSRTRDFSNFLKDLDIKTINKSETTIYFIENLQEDKNEEKESLEPEGYDLNDWLNAFVKRAEGASSDKMRSILGRILAGEIYKPGNFSVATLRIVAELDYAAAKTFQDLCTTRVQTRLLPKLTTHISGEWLYKLYDLEERGLVKEVTSSLSVTMAKNPDDFFYFVDENFILKFLIVMDKLEIMPISNVINFFILTRSGLELARLFPLDKSVGMRAIASEMLRHDAVKKIYLIDKTANTANCEELIFDRD